jgi:hypothetical protein
MMLEPSARSDGKTSTACDSMLARPRLRDVIETPLGAVLDSVANRRRTHPNYFAGSSAVQSAILRLALASEHLP